MCGIVAIISKKLTGFSELELKLFHQALYTNALRGKDSTGIFSISSEGNIHIIKDNTDANTFLNTNDVKKEFEKYYLNSRILVGHNRSATKGHITDKNAHPFLSNDTVLIHNGTIYNHTTLANTETDSEALCVAISTKPYKDILENIDGAYALIFYKAKEKLLYVIKNKERPLWIISTNDFDFIFSEAKMGEWLYHRLFNKEIEAHYFENLKPYVWNLTKLSDSFTDEEPIKEKKRHSYFQTNIQIIGKTTYTKNNLYINQIIPIYIDFVFQIKDNIYEIIGSNSNNPEIIFYCKEITQNPPEINDLVYTKIVSIPQQNKIYTKIIPNIIEFYSINNKDCIIFEEGITCSKCKKILTEEKDQHSVWIKQHTNKQHTILCKSCIKSIPKLNNDYPNI